MTTEALERELMNDVESHAERLGDEEFCTDLYRALARNVWTKEGVDGRLSLSFGRAAELVNELRARHGHGPLQLEQGGEEGEVSNLIVGEIGGDGWNIRALDTTHHDPEHQGRFESPPPADREPQEWERRAHEEADESLRRRGR